jgi:N-hydroxyarylamine O-acetyltransferase
MTTPAGPWPNDPATSIDAALAERVIARLGLDNGVTVDASGLAQLYRQWCRKVPFDNVRKLIALRSGPDAALPGRSATDFFEAWLEHGVGGTCWPGAIALTALCRSLGFDARLLAASMADTGVASHGTTVVRIDGDDWLVDSSMLTDQPLRLSSEEGTEIAHPVFATTATPVAEGWLFGFALPYSNLEMPCRTLSADPVTVDFCLARYEASREMSPFNAHVSTRRNDDDGVVSYGGSQRFRRTADGIDEGDLAGPALRAALTDEFAMSSEIVANLDAVGGFAG